MNIKQIFITIAFIAIILLPFAFKAWAVVNTHSINSSIVIASIREDISFGPKVNTMSVNVNILRQDVLTAFSVNVPIVSSPIEMNRNLKNAIKKEGISEGILQEGDEILLLGGATH